MIYLFKFLFWLYLIKLSIRDNSLFSNRPNATLRKIILLWICKMMWINIRLSLKYLFKRSTPWPMWTLPILNFKSLLFSNMIRADTWITVEKQTSRNRVKYVRNYWIRWGQHIILWYAKGQRPYDMAYGINNTFIQHINMLSCH